MEVLKVTAAAGFVTASVLLISLNHKVFKFIFKEKTASYWWLFTVLTVFPLLLILYIFSLLFGV